MTKRPCPSCEGNTIPGNPGVDYRPFNELVFVDREDGSIEIDCPHCNRRLWLDPTREVIALCPDDQCTMQAVAKRLAAEPELDKMHEVDVAQKFHVHPNLIFWLRWKDAKPGDRPGADLPPALAKRIRFLKAEVR